LRTGLRRGWRTGAGLPACNACNIAMCANITGRCPCARKDQHFGGSLLLDPQRDGQP